MDMEQIKALATMESDIKHISARLGNIDSSLERIQELVIEQNDLRKDVSNLLAEHEVLQERISGVGEKISAVKADVDKLGAKLTDMPKNIKGNIFDYVWKYLLIAIGAWMVAKFSGILP